MSNQFPPKKGSRRAPAQPADTVQNPVSTGNGGIPASLKIKAAGTTPSRGVEKTVDAS